MSERTLRSNTRLEMAASSSAADAKHVVPPCEACVAKTARVLARTKKLKSKYDADMKMARATRAEASARVSAACPLRKADGSTPCWSLPDSASSVACEKCAKEWIAIHSQYMSRRTLLKQRVANNRCEARRRSLKAGACADCGRFNPVPTAPYETRSYSTTNMPVADVFNPA